MESVLLVNAHPKFGPNVFVPYAAGRIWASIISSPGLAEKYQLARFKSSRPAGFVYLRENPDALVADLEHVDVALVSFYEWMMMWNNRFLRALKARFPKVHIVAGGPSATADMDRVYWTTPPLLGASKIVGPGENAIRFLLDCRPQCGVVRADIVSHGLSVAPEHNPSPYLTGVLDEVIADGSRRGYLWNAPHESSRGCPFHCVYCAWDASPGRRDIAEFPLSTVLSELDWFADHKIHLVYNTDANFGMLRSADAILQRLLELHRSTGWPKKFRTDFARPHVGRFLDLGLLKEAADLGLTKGVTLSVQSMDSSVTTAIRRGERDVDDYAENLQKYAGAGIPTYTEVIVGLPGETLESFVRGLDAILSDGQHDGLAVYSCLVLPGSELATPAYREEHEIHTVRVPTALNHGAPDDTIEYVEVVVGTKSMPPARMREAYLFAWAVQVFDVLGLFRDLIAYAVSSRGITPAEVIATIMHAATKKGPSDILGMVTSRAVHEIERFFAGQRSGTIRWGLQWPLEEYSFIALIEAYDFQKWGRDCCDVLSALEVPPGSDASLHRWWERIVKPSEYLDLETYAREVVWYGRKGGSVLRKELRP
jgi:putative methyltransferase